MFDRFFAYFVAKHENRQLAYEFGTMTDRDFDDIGIDSADVPRLLEQNFQRLYTAALAARADSRRNRVRRQQAA
jgi:hypothetical protein